MENNNYFTEIPLDLFLMICESLTIDQINRLCGLRKCSIHFSDQLYKMKFGTIPEGKSADEFFTHVWKIYVTYTHKKEYADLLANMSAQGMINEVNYILDVYSNKFNKSDYIRSLKRAIEGGHFGIVKRLLEVTNKKNYYLNYTDLLETSIQHGRPEIFKYLFGLMDIPPDWKHLNLLKKSIKYGERKIFEYLFELIRKSIDRMRIIDLLEYVIEYKNIDSFNYLFDLIREFLNDREYFALIRLAIEKENPGVLKFLIQHRRDAIEKGRIINASNYGILFGLAKDGNNEKVTEIIIHLGDESMIDWTHIFTLSAQKGYKNLLRYSLSKLENLRKIEDLNEIGMRDTFETDDRKSTSTRRLPIRRPSEDPKKVKMREAFEKAFRKSASNGHLEILKFLIEHQLDEKFIGSTEYKYGMQIAAEKNYPEIIKYLSHYAHGSDIHDALIIAIKHNHKEIVKLLLDLPLDPHFFWRENHLNYDELLEMANGNNQIINLLIKFRNDVMNKYYYHQISELSKEQDYQNILKLLSNMYQYPLRAAYYYDKIIEKTARNGYLDILKLIDQLNAGNDELREDEYYYSNILENAAKGGQREVMKWITEGNRFLDKEEFEDAIGIAFVLAAYNDQREIMEWMISYYGDTLTKDYYIEALESAIAADQEDIVKWIYEMIKDTLTQMDIMNMIYNLKNEKPNENMRKFMDAMKFRSNVK